MSIEITEDELQAILDDIRLGHESNEDIIAMIIPDRDTEGLHCVAPPRPTLQTITTNEFPLLEDIPIPLQRPTLVRSIAEVNDIQEPTLLRSITTDLPRPTLLRSIAEVNDIPEPTLLRSTTNNFPAPLLPLSQCVTNDSPEPPDDELQRCTNDEYRLSTSHLGVTEENALLSEPDRLPITAEEVAEIVQGFRKA